MTAGTDILLAEERFVAEARALKLIRALVAERLRDSGCGEACVQDVVLAVDEACQNIIRHAYAGRSGDIVVEIRRDGDRVIVRLLDFAPPVDVARVHPRPLDELRPGGLGTHLMRETMDEVSFLPPPPGVGNLLQLVKRIG